MLCFRCDSPEKLKAILPRLEQELKDTGKFKDFYQFTFNFAKNPGQKGLGKQKNNTLTLQKSSVEATGVKYADNWKISKCCLRFLVFFFFLLLAINRQKIKFKSSSEHFSFLFRIGDGCCLLEPCSYGTF